MSYLNSATARKVCALAIAAAAVLDITGVRADIYNRSGTLIPGTEGISAVPGANLSSFDLHYANLSSTNLTTALFISSNLATATFTGSNLTSADLTSANLASASLWAANLTGANFTDANVLFADWSLSNFTAAQLYSTASYKSFDLTGVRFTNTAAIG